jgi:SAM-dependent methyltransferase
MSYFSQQAKLYAEYRPDYPAELFDFAASLAPRHEVAWDCATGSGQAAVGLAQHFARVIATDASPEQISHARLHDRIEYRVATAESSGLAAASVDLVTVTQALHWLDLERFYAEVRRVLVPQGALMVTVYSDPTLEHPELDAILRHYNKVVVGPYWPEGRRLVDEHYRSVPFPFAEVETPTLTLQKRWRLAELAGYLRSWSATVRYQKARNTDPVLEVEAKMQALWSDPASPRSIRWPFTIRAGRV